VNTPPQQTHSHGTSHKLTTRDPKYTLLLMVYTTSDIEYYMLNPLTPRVSYGDTMVVLTFESVDEILGCRHSNETSSAVLSHGSIYIQVLIFMK